MVSRLSVGKIILYSVLILVIIISVIAASYSVITKYEVAEKIDNFFNKEEDAVYVKAISESEMSMLKTGTSLSFGDPSKPSISLIVTPSELSRTKDLVGSKPSELLNAVKDKDVLLNVYLSGQDGASTTGIENIINVASCNTYRDETPGKIATLSRIIESVNKVGDLDDYDTVAQKMGVDEEVLNSCKEDIEKMDKIEQSTQKTLTNTIHFLQVFNIYTKPNHIIVNGQMADRVDVFEQGWVQNIIDNKPLISSIKDSVVIKSYNS